MAKRKPASTTEETLLSAGPETYTVLARRYRPQQFKDIIGQAHVAQALINAIESKRIAHAYLFTGPRGVGKTSTARILAKALNCVTGPTAEPCGQCEICRSIASGEDVDVLEIDGASNNRVDEIRDLRQNVQYRPARARFKIYIIDEVHMVTTAAFNALLKTLEEPPPHVKFIFATTEVQKIPLTILSRCQRFDFAGIGTAKIMEHLRQMVAGEKLQADDEALELIARRAAGSMRDAQSLLDQLLAFGEEKLTAEHVYRLLGTAHIDQVVALAKAVLEHDPKEALELLGRSLDEGLQLGELLDQLIDYWRDLMVLRCAGDYGDISVPPRHRDTVVQQANMISLDSILAGLDILGTTKARLRGSNHGRVLVEMALVRLGRLDDLVSLSQLSQWLNPGEGRSKAEDRRLKVEDRAMKSEDRGTKSEDRRSRIEEYGLIGENPQNQTPAALDNGMAPDDHFSKAEPRSSPIVPDSSVAIRELTESTLTEIWPAVLEQVGPMLGGNLRRAESVAISGPKALVIRFPSRYNHERDYCQLSNSVTRMQEAIRKLTGQAWNIRVESAGDEPAGAPVKTTHSDNAPSSYRRQRADASQEPLVKRAMDLLSAQIVHVDDGFGTARLETAERVDSANSEEIEAP
jgi:DNA polymerase-3 subunit gamma/tau